MKSFDDVRAGLEKRLGAEGWTIAFHQGRAAYSTLVFSHELSGDFHYSFRAQDFKQHDLDEFLARREFESVRNRPSELPHAAFIGHLRKMAGAQRWPPEAFIVIARSLGVYGLIGEGEADWLEDAGPAWRSDWEPMRAD